MASEKDKTQSQQSAFESYEEWSLKTSDIPWGDFGEGDEWHFNAGDLLGRYQVISELGAGGFGHVVKANDPKLRRTVAIKVPRLERVAESKEAFVEEARSLARLDHPSIVRVFNVEETEDGTPFVVMEYVDGQTLSELLSAGGLTYEQASAHLLQVARALSYAHQETVIHRDIKPANIIVADGLARLMDFGMALHDLTPEESLVNVPQGTPSFMAPEQIRGENHRLDCRTDVWAFGVILYLMISGTKPFAGKDILELANDICHRSPRSSRELNPNAPIELERISMKCLEKRMKDRYQNMAELIEEFELLTNRWDSGESTQGSTAFLKFGATDSFRLNANQSSDTQDTATNTINTGVSFVPKGLRSFDEQDANFFLEMIAGPKDQSGIPDSLRFWANRLKKDSNDPLPVGLIYGPSGCGKSSFVKAGLLPQLESDVRTIYLEATTDKTESQLLEKLCVVQPSLSSAKLDELPQIFGRIRRGNALIGDKLLIVIDQFEQWLHQRSEYDSHPLTQALRQCDGENLSVILLVRDDFWMSISQFMAALDVTIQEGGNSLGIPLFDRSHARKVLTGFGRALGAIPAGSADADQKRFVSEAVKQMEAHGQIIPIHIAMIAQMMDADSWNLNSLKKMGGWEGIGIHFLDKIFDDKRFSGHQETCRILLTSLLPDSQTPIKGAQKSTSQLESLFEKDQKQNLKLVLDLLDREFKIITPAESTEQEANYQLAHDSLVLPIKNWIAKKDNETWQGRTRARLGSLAKQWHLNGRENRFLPSLLEFAPMQFSARGYQRNEIEKQFLKKSNLYYAVRALLASAVVAAIAWGVHNFLHQSDIGLAKERIEQFATAHPMESNARMQLLKEHEPSDIFKIVNEHSGTDWANRTSLRHLLAKAQFCEPGNFPLKDLLAAVRVSPRSEFKNIVQQLKRGAAPEFGLEISQRLSKQFGLAESDDERFRFAVAAMHLGNTNPLTEFLAFAPDPEQREFFIETLPVCNGDLGEIISLLRHSKDAAMLTAVCKALGLLEADQFSDEEFHQLSTNAKSLFLNSPFGNVHSASQWLLEKNNIQLPNVIGVSKPGWEVRQFGTGQSITFVRIPKHEFLMGSGLTPAEQKLSVKEIRRTKIEKEFLVSAKEVSVDHYGDFVKSLSVDNKIRQRFEKANNTKLQNKNLPIAKITMIEAALFCNWLSVQAGKRPVYDCKQGIGKTTVDVLPDSNGYRLATVIEWEAMNRAGTNTRYFFGNSLARIGQYAWTGVTPYDYDGKAVGQRGAKMPNDFGVFDSLGNTFEWCENSYGTRVDHAAIRGGSTDSEHRYFQSASYFDSALTDSGDVNGIRLVLHLDSQ